MAATSTSTTPSPGDAAELDAHGAAHDHPADGHYIKIALFLGALTAVETSTYFFPALADNVSLLLLILMPVMIVKFAMVAWFFMHLGQDSRVFSRMFLTGIVLACVVYIIVLLAFDELF